MSINNWVSAFSHLIRVSLCSNFCLTFCLPRTLPKAYKNPATNTSVEIHLWNMALVFLVQNSSSLTRDISRLELSDRRTSKICFAELMQLKGVNREVTYSW